VASRWATRLKDALAADEFVLALQPIVSLEDRRVVFSEALIRLPEGNRLNLPGEFLPTAERFGLLPAVDRWVVKRTLEQLQACPSDRIFVNLGRASFEDDELLDWIGDEVRRIGLAPGRLGLEITETVAVQETARVRENLSRLREAGCLIALDDFGSGFASFVELTRLPIDFVKIAEPFTNGWTEDHSRSLAVVSAIAGVAQAFGVQVIGEQIETELVAHELRRLGIQYGQGYLFGRPQARKAARRLIRPASARTSRRPASPSETGLRAS
jgi:EAL domain-containing protein (putative c-di-GMP-specific phosphodiesterase class I)